MAKIKPLIASIFGLALMGCGQTPASVDEKPVELESDTKVLLTYFSRADENYNVGYVDKGNTEWLADFIGEKVNPSKTFKIERVTPYPAAYNECTEEAKKEQNENARPQIKGSVDDFASYDVIFLGYPIWWSDLPMPVYTFIEGQSWNNKTVIPFSTHEGSGWGVSLDALANKLSGATIKKGYNCRGALAKNKQSEVNSWLGGLGF